jgi:crossover junction endodeoxyribonuclease RuvC
MVVLGLDPGSHHVGYAFVDTGPRSDCRVLEYGVLHAPTKAPLYERIGVLLQALHPLLDQYQPVWMAAEECFVQHNVKTALILGQARGALLGTAWLRGMKVKEYAPTSIKQAVTGRGGASKDQVAWMLQRHLSLREIPQNRDATDALAVAWTAWQDLRQELLGTVTPLL